MLEFEDDLDERIKNTADLIAKFADENLTPAQAKEIKDILPKYDEKQQKNKKKKK